VVRVFGILIHSRIEELAEDRVIVVVVAMADVEFGGDDRIDMSARNGVRWDSGMTVEIEDIVVVG
jgi:hypothetical protein